MKTTKPVQAGEEILNEHGEAPRADLLRRYGFVTDNYAQYDVVELSLSTICQAAGLDNDDVETQPPVFFQLLLLLRCRTVIHADHFQVAIPRGIGTS